MLSCFFLPFLYHKCDEENEDVETNHDCNDKNLYVDDDKKNFCDDDSYDLKELEELAECDPDDSSMPPSMRSESL